MTARILRIILFVLLVVGAVGCDLSSKIAARLLLQNIGRVEVIDDILILQYAENSGAFLGLGAEWPWIYRILLFNVTTIVMVIIIVAYVSGSQRLPKLRLLAVSFIAGGGLGNLLDRLKHDGFVTDFMHIDIGYVRTGIFNAADVFILTGVVLYLLTTFYHEREETVRRQRGIDDPPSETDVTEHTS